MASEEPIDVDMLQAQIEVSVNMAKSLVSSWLPAVEDQPSVAKPANISNIITDFSGRPPRLGLGATPRSQSQSNYNSGNGNMYTLAEKKLQSKLTNNRKRNRDEFDDSGLPNSNPKSGRSKAKNSSRKVDESSDDEESKTKSITKKVGSVNSAKQSFDRHDPTNSNTTKAIPSPASSLPNAASNSNLPGAVTLVTSEAQDAKLKSDISITNGDDSKKGVKSVANRTVSTASDVLNHYLNSRSNGSEKKKRKKKKNKNKNKNDSSATETQLAD